MFTHLATSLSLCGVQARPQTPDGAAPSPLSPPTSRRGSRQYQWRRRRQQVIRRWEHGPVTHPQPGSSCWDGLMVFNVCEPGYGIMVLCVWFTHFVGGLVNYTFIIISQLRCAGLHVIVARFLRPQTLTGVEPSGPGVPRPNFSNPNAKPRERAGTPKSSISTKLR